MKLYKIIIKFSDLEARAPIIGEIAVDDEEKAIKTARENQLQFPNAEITLFKIGDEILWQDSIK